MADERDSSPELSPAAPAKSLGPAALLELVEKIYKSFNPAQVTLDTHVDKCLSELQIANSHDDTFIRQVVYGIIRYRQFLGSIMDSFYHYNGGTALREDMDMYKVYCYLTIFRLEELGYGNLKRLVDAKEPQKMVVLFRYLFDEGYLQGPLRDGWLKLYDKEFVDGIVGKLLGFKPEIAQLLDSLEELVYFTRRRGDDAEASTSSPSGGAGDSIGRSASGARRGSGGPGGLGARAATTVPRPFNLSEPRPKPLPVEEPPPPPTRLKPPPKLRQGPTKEEQAIAAARELNKKRAEIKLAKASPFKLRSTERPTTLDKIRAEIEADLARQLTFQPPKPSPVPPPPTAPVKLNTAAILREDALYRKKQAEEAAALQRYEAELRDASRFKSWQSDMLQKDEAARQAEIEARRQAMVAVQDAVAKARDAQLAENREAAAALKAEARAIEEAREREREAEILAKQSLRQVVVDGRVGAAQAAERVAAERRTLAEEERKTQAAHAKALMEAELRDIAEKRDIIMQLRALEKAPRQRVVEFDPTTMPDHGLLESMPLVELRERLAVAKRREKEEEERRRAQNLAARQEKESMLLDKVANIQRVRKVAAVQAHTRRAKVKEEEVVAEAAVKVKHDAGVLVLHESLEAKRAAAAAEKARIAAEVKKIRFEQMQAAAGAAAVEEAKFRELREGARREAMERQAFRLQEAGTYEATKSKAQSVRMRNVKASMRDKADFMRAYEDRLAAASAQAAAEARSDSQRRAGLVNSQRTTELETRARNQTQAYQPFSGSQTTLQARLAALAEGTDEL